MPTVELDRLARDMVAVAWLEGDFVLRSGRRSRYYFDKYLFETQPSILRRAGRELARLVPPDTQRLGAPPPGGGLPRRGGSPRAAPAVLPGRPVGHGGGGDRG